MLVLSDIEGKEIYARNMATVFPYLRTRLIQGSRFAALGASPSDFWWVTTAVILNGKVPGTNTLQLEVQHYM